MAKNKPEQPSGGAGSNNDHTSNNKGVADYYNPTIRIYVNLVEKPMILSIDILRRFMRYEASGGFILVFAALLAIFVANSRFADGYHHFLHLPVTLGVGGAVLEKSLQHFVNDGLMAVFFLLVGMEIKREFVEGELSRRDQALLPLVAAASGMAVPALIYVWFTRNNPELFHGWAIPAATDIAFAIGVMALVGSRVPFGMKVLLVAIAIIDDLGSILIIALFYTSDLSLNAILGAGGLVMLLISLNRIGVTSRTAYLLVGFVLWLFVLKSGIHATLAGVFTALAMPLRAKDYLGRSPLVSLETSLTPWVTFMIVPIFGYVNAGLSFEGIGLPEIFSPLSVGIAMGLLLGKQVGIFSSIFLMVKLGICKLPRGTDWPHIYAMSILCGIGFTISLFIGELAFTDKLLLTQVRIGVFGGSIVAALMGYGLMLLLPPSHDIGDQSIIKKGGLARA